MRLFFSHPYAWEEDNRIILHKMSRIALINKKKGNSWNTSSFMYTLIWECNMIISTHCFKAYIQANLKRISELFHFIAALYPHFRVRNASFFSVSHLFIQSCFVCSKKVYSPLHNFNLFTQNVFVIREFFLFRLLMAITQVETENLKPKNSDV